MSYQSDDLTQTPKFGFPRPRRRRRPRSVGVFSSGESPIVPQLCPVSLIVEHSGLIEDDDEHEDENPDFGV